MKYRLVLGLFLVAFLLILAACGSSTTSSSQQGQATPSGSQTVQVTLSDNKVESSLTASTTGMPYHFVVTNRGQVAHQSALFMYDSIASGGTRTFDYTFSMSSVAQSFAFVCGTQGHYGAGMQLPF